MENMVDTKYMAKVLGYSKARICQLAKEGKIPAVRRGRKWFFKPGLVIGAMTEPNDAPEPEPSDEKVTFE